MKSPQPQSFMFDGWDSFAFFFLAICSAMLLVGSGIGWCIWANQQLLVKWLGCGCPVIDEFGNMVEDNFNANDFTALDCKIEDILEFIPANANE